MNQVPVYVNAAGEQAGEGPPATSAPSEHGSSAFHPLTLNSSAYYGTPAGANAFHTTPSTSTYVEHRGKYFNSLSLTTMQSSMIVSSVVDSVAGSSGSAGRQMHHIQSDCEPQESMSFMDTFFVDAPSSSHVHDMSIDPTQEPMIDLKDKLYDTEEERRMRHAESSRLRYHRLTDQQKKEVNMRRAERIKKQRQRDKEINELETILRSTNDIADEPALQEALRVRRLRQRRAEAARRRYHRMTVDERREYNQRRRLRQMGLDPDGPPRGDPSRIRAKIMEMNAKKAAAARARYHAMSEDERRMYNARRTAAFRRRRVEEEMLLSTPAGRISADALQRAQKIMMRNAKKAEAARLRYQRMSFGERKTYNQRRAMAKKQRGDALTPGLPSSSISIGSHDMSEGPISPGMTGELLDPVTIEPSMPSPEKQSVHLVENRETSDTLAAMERDVEQRTMLAHKQLTHSGRMSTRSAAQLQPQQHQRFIVQEQTPLEPLVVLVTTEQVVDSSGKETIYLQPASSLINEKQLQIMLHTGRDETGRPVEIRTLDGQVITTTLREEVPASAQLIDVTSQMTESKYPPMDNLYGNISHQEVIVEEERGRVLQQTSMQMGHQQMHKRTMTQAHYIKQEMSKQRRAEKARQRYHSMTPEERAQFNSKRAEALRKARKRDEELIQMADAGGVDHLDDGTKTAILEAQRRRARRAELARAKYHRMNSDERRQYNAMRDAQRRQRKREMDSHLGIGRSKDDREDESCTPDGDHQRENDAADQIAYTSYEIYPQDSY